MIYTESISTALALLNQIIGLEISKNNNYIFHCACQGNMERGSQGTEPNTELAAQNSLLSGSLSE